MLCFKKLSELPPVPIGTTGAAGVCTGRSSIKKPFSMRPGVVAVRNADSVIMEKTYFNKKRLNITGK